MGHLFSLPVLGIRGEASWRYASRVAGFAVHWGWRKNEILSLTWDEIDEAGGVIRLRDNLIHEQELLDADDQFVAYLAQQAHMVARAELNNVRWVSPTAGTWSSSQWRPDNEFETDRVDGRLIQHPEDPQKIAATLDVLLADVAERTTGSERPAPRQRRISRKNEILDLTRDEIDEAGGVIRLLPARSKTWVGRILPISQPIAEALARRRAHRDPTSPLVFHRDGITVRRWRTAWRTACQAAGGPTRGARWRGRRETIQLLLEQKILRDHRSHATGATQRRGHDGPVK